MKKIKENGIKVFWGSSGTRNGIDRCSGHGDPGK